MTWENGMWINQDEKREDRGIVPRILFADIRALPRIIKTAMGKAWAFVKQK